MKKFKLYDFEWPLLLIILLVFCIVLGVGLVVCCCMIKEGDQEREYERLEREKKDDMESLKNLEDAQKRAAGGEEGAPADGEKNVDDK